MVHDGRMLYESTAIMEYVDDAFDGPALSPKDPEARWRMRWWMKYCDQYYAPSASMIGWSVFIGPSVRSKDPEMLKAKIEAIPLKERRIAWSQGDLRHLLPGGAGGIRPPRRRRRQADGRASLTP